MVGKQIPPPFSQDLEETDECLGQERGRSPSSFYYLWLKVITQSFIPSYEGYFDRIGNDFLGHHKYECTYKDYTDSPSINYILSSSTEQVDLFFSSLFSF